MFRFGIDTTNMIILFDGAEPVYDYDTGELKTDEKRGTQYRLHTLTRTSEDRASQSLVVKVFAPKNPADSIKLYSQIKFEALTALVYEMNGKTGVSFSADSVSPVQVAK